jgi:hypothetical protein
MRIPAWGPLTTNPFDGSGNFIFTNPINRDDPALLYLLQLPYNLPVYPSFSKALVRTLMKHFRNKANRGLISPG